ncbi:MAG: sensor histidine kinase, partial [bacterium]
IKTGDEFEDLANAFNSMAAEIKRNIKDLNDLVKELAHILEGIKLQPQKFSLEETINSVLSNFQPHLQNKKLVVNQELKVKEIVADKERLTIVLENLIANAIKFADPCTEINLITSRYSENSKDYFLFRITNRGAEIPQDKTEIIFEPFYQIDSSTSRRYGGVGLGLTIAKNIIEAHYGRIKVHSKNGFVTFEFIIPQEGKNEKEYLGD